MFKNQFLQLSLGRRNPFEILKLFPAIPPAPEKANNQVDSELIARAFEQSPLLNGAEPKINSCCKMTTGPASIDSIFKTLVDDCLSSERNKEKKAHLITINSNLIRLLKIY